MTNVVKTITKVRQRRISNFDTHFLNVGSEFSFENIRNTNYTCERKNVNIQIQKSHSNIRMDCEYSNIRIFVAILTK